MSEEFSDDFEIIDNFEMPDDLDNVRYNEDKMVEDFGLGHIKKTVDNPKIKDESNESNDSGDVTEADSTSKLPDPFLVNKKKYLQTHTPNSIDQFTKCLIVIAVFAIGFGMGYYVGSSKQIIFRHIKEEFIKDLDERFNHCFGFVDNLQAQLEGINIHLKKQSFLENSTKPSVENEFKAFATGDKQMLNSESGFENLDKTKLEINLNSAESTNMDIQPSLNVNTQNKLSMQSQSSQNSESRKDTHSYCRKKKELKLKAIKYLTIELQRFIRSLTEDSFYKLHHDDVQHYRQEFSQHWKRLTNHKLYDGEYYEFDGSGSEETNSNENLIDYSWVSCQQNWWKLLEESHYINFNSLKKHKTKVFSKLKLKKCISFYEFWQLKVICNIIHLRREIYEQRNIGDESNLKYHGRDLCPELCETLPMGC